MKVVALGGAGHMGQAAVRAAAKMPELREIIVADLDLANARAFADSLHEGREKVSTQAADVRDSNQLRQLLADADIVLNMVGPFYRFGAPVLDAAIDTATHYMDICDDWEPALELMKRHGRAAEAGLSCVTGMGMSPGASNLLAALAVRELDSVTDLYTVWPVSVPMPGLDVLMAEADSRRGEVRAGAGPSAAVLHWMQQISGMIRTVENGQEIDTPPLEPRRLAYPNVGNGTAYTVGHPEPVTLTRSFVVTGQCACLMLISPPTLAIVQEAREAIDNGRRSIEEAAKFAGRRVRSNDQSLSTAGYESPGALPPFFALARGMRGGRQTTVGARVTAFPSGMAGGTSLSLAVGLEQFLKGRITKRGVFPPEQVIDPELFFSDLAPFCDAGEQVNGSVVSVDVASVGADPLAASRAS